MLASGKEWRGKTYEKQNAKNYNRPERHAKRIFRNSGAGGFCFLVKPENKNAVDTYRDSAQEIHDLNEIADGQQK